MGGAAWAEPDAGDAEPCIAFYFYAVRRALPVREASTHFVEHMVMEVKRKVVFQGCEGFLS